MVWFGLSLGASEEQALAYWDVPNPAPKVWQRARLKTSDGKPYGVYLHGDFKNQSAPNTPVSVEHIFVGNQLSVTTWYFSGITPLTRQRDLPRLASRALQATTTKALCRSGTSQSKLGLFCGR